MNALMNLGLSADELRTVAADIGSDVPFLVEGGTVRGRGRGEILQALPPLSGVWFVLVTPNLEVSARDAYGRARIGLTGRKGFTKLNCSAIQSGDLEALAEGLENDLEAGVVCACPEVGRAKARLLDSGARAAAMCGSGPTVLGLAWSKEEASDIASRAGVRDWRIYVAEPITAGCTLTFETAASERAKRHQRDPEEI
jgi:4-diphosphocytidyl-2-C-methyl-D-erythritol kinase